MMENGDVRIVSGKTYGLLQFASCALVTSGTATLETALLRVPQVVCYYIPMGGIVSFLRKILLKVRFVSLVNLIAGDEIVKGTCCRRHDNGQCARGIGENSPRRQLPQPGSPRLRGRDTHIGRLRCLGASRAGNDAVPATQKRKRISFFCDSRQGLENADLRE